MWTPEAIAAFVSSLDGTAKSLGRMHVESVSFQVYAREALKSQQQQMDRLQAQIKQEARLTREAREGT